MKKQIQKLIVILFVALTVPAFSQYNTTINIGDGAGGSGGGLDSIAYASNKLSSDVTMTNANTWYDGPSVTLSAGTWLVNAQELVWYNPSIAEHIISFRISDGSVYYSSSDHTVIGGGFVAITDGAVASSLTSIITLSGTTTIKAQAKSGATNHKILAAAMGAASGNNASQINAIKLSE